MQFILHADTQAGFFAQDGGDAHGVVVARGLQITQADFEHGQEKSLGLQLAVGQAVFLEQGGAADFEPGQVAPVVNDTHHVGFGIADADFGSGGDHR